ncbi:MAG: hypothetical protein ACLSHC_10550 [Bilophila wadsworthia]
MMPFPAERLCDVLPTKEVVNGHGDESQSARTARRGQNRDQQRLEDAWFIGFTPHLVTGACTSGKTSPDDGP